MKIRTNRASLSRVIGAVAVTSTLIFGLTACNDSDKKSNQKMEQQQANAGISQMLRDQPVPAFGWSQLRQNLIEIETAEANGVQTTSFFFNQGVQDPIMSCPSIGAPIATTTQITNPLQTESHSDTSGGNTVLNQMDPTGIYSGDSSGTYVMCIDNTGKPYATYWEGYVNTVFGPATWDKGTHQVTLTGASSFKFTKGH